MYVHDDYFATWMEKLSKNTKPLMFGSLFTRTAIIGIKRLLRKVRKKKAGNNFMFLALTALFFLPACFSLRKCASGSSFTRCTCAPISQNFGGGCGSRFAGNFISHISQFIFNPNHASGLTLAYFTFSKIEKISSFSISSFSLMVSLAHSHNFLQLQLDYSESNNVIDKEIPNFQWTDGAK